ncbi:hypothetical protein WR25_02286 [Diploscapter pachys]|uniref:Uncharacterized protein n=1 Tax=Diploscapter pachys TaxID=2018661 RepID=A0A2A2M537_9BILA|nr:hypothetical protein WR25_02286 [Diploscapter pachys]
MDPGVRRDDGYERGALRRPDAARQRRHVQARKAVMLQPADIAVEEGAKVVHAVFQHGEPVDPAAERKALPFVGVQPARFDDLGVDHAAAQHLHPAAARPTDHALALLDRIADVDFRRRWPSVMPLSITSPST